MDEQQESDAAFSVVGIGASAGGIAALETMVRRFTDDAMVFVVVPHMHSDQARDLVTRLARCTPNPVVAITDGVRVERGHIYVASHESNVAIAHRTLHPSKPANDRPAHPIDFFLRSLAADRGAGAIGVVLSGAGSDGAIGLGAIKAEGGLAFVQDPATAEFDGMPISAIEAGVADFVLAPAQIADALMEIGARRTLDRPALAIDAILALLFGAFGHDLTLYKQGMIERRIERRMALHKLFVLDDYIALVQRRPAELAALYRDLLIGVTSFFRDNEPFERLETVVVPALIERSDRPIRIWVPACSTGEEAYSVAMVLREGAHAFDMFATDIDASAIDRARRGLYDPSIVGDVSVARLSRFFVVRDDGYLVRRRLRDAIDFEVHDVTADPPWSGFDLVSCRNLLIYFQPELQRRVLRVFHRALRAGGMLMLGASESAGDAPELFSLVDRQGNVYRRMD